MKYTDVMLDIETVGTTPGCAIIQIAAVPFNANTGEISGNTFSYGINLNKQLDNGFTIEKRTHLWWKETNNELYEKLCNSEGNHVDIALILEKWFTSLENYRQIRVWGNSARFDIGILEQWCRNIHHSFNPFWNNWKERCCRTLFSLDDVGRRNIPFEGVPHNAIDDCKHQIKYLQYIKEKFNLTIG